MNNPSVSVIIPNYCHSKFLDERIMSVLNQTYQNFELIILDDCSPDNGASKAVIKKYRNNPKVSHIVYNEVNSGSTFKQWNKGFDLAKGELIWIAESDDSCEDTLLEALVYNFKVDKDVVLSYCSSQIINENGLRKSKKKYAPWTSDFTLKGTDFVKKYMLMYNAIYNASAVVFRKDVLAKISNIYMDYKSAGDRLFWGAIALNGKVSYTAKQLNLFRQHSQKVTPKSTYSGQNDKEDFRTYGILSEKIKIGWLWKRIIAGYYYQYISKTEYESGVKEMLVDMWKKSGLFNKSSYVVYRLCRFLKMF